MLIRLHQFPTASLARRRSVPVLHQLHQLHQLHGMKRSRDPPDDHAGAQAKASSSAAAVAAPAAEPKHTNFTAPSAALSIDTAAYQSQLDAKLLKLKTLFSDLAMPEVEVLTSVPQHYRLRTEFTVYGTRAGEQPQYVMFATAPTDADEPGEEEPGAAHGEDEEGGATAPAEQPAAEAAAAAATEAAGAAVAKAKGRGKGKAGKQKKPSRPRVEITSFPVGSLVINELMPLVLDACCKVPVLKERLFQVGYHTALSGEAIVTLFYHKKLDEQWSEAARALRPVLAAGAPSANGHVPHIVGRSRKQKVCLDQDFVVEKLLVHGREYVYRQYEGSFSQPNGIVCQKMLEWAVEATRGSNDHDLLELYCGNGNFTLPLSQNFRRVVATEVSKVGVEAAKWNVEANGATGKIFVGRLSSEEFVETWRAQGTRRRLEGLWDWSELSLKTLFVDPPRAGLDADTCKLMSEFERIVYVSCNPETLHANLKGIAGVTHDVVKFAAFDQFPFTHHLESGVYLVKKQQGA